MTLPVQADFRYLFSTTPGQTAANWGFGSPLEEALRTAGLNLLNAPADSLPPASLNLALMVISAAQPASLKAVYRALQPGATLLLGFANPLSLRRFSGDPKTFSLLRLPGLLRRLGLCDLQTFGVYDSLQEPRAIVPLAEPRLAAFFFHSVFTPYTRRARWLAAAAPWLCRLRLQQSLFPALCLRAAKP